MEGYRIKSGRSLQKKIFLAILAIFIIGSASWFLYFTWKVHAVSQGVSIGNSEDASFISDVQSVVSTVVKSDHKKLQGEEEGRINILLLGKAGGDYPGKNLTDTIMIMSIDTEQKKIALLSLPRDLYAPIADTEFSTKINSIYQYGLKNDEGINQIEETIEEITSQKIHYFFVLDFEGFKKIIDDVGGVNVTVEKDIYDPRYPGPNYSYEIFQLEKGLHHLDGETALKYARERHNDPEGDFGRSKRQQKVIQATKNRVFSLQTFLNVFTLNNLLNTLEEHLKTNISLEEIESFINLSKQVDSQNITNVVVDAWDKDSLLKVSHINTGSGRMFILVPRVGNFSEVQELAENIFELDKIKKRREEIEKEDAKIGIINKSSDTLLAGKIRSLLGDKLNIKDVTIIYSDGSETRDQTLVVDNSGGGKLFTLDELIKKLPAKLSANDDIIEDSGQYDLIIILGSDIERAYAYEEDSIENLKEAELDQEYLEPIEN